MERSNQKIKEIAKDMEKNKSREVYENRTKYCFMVPQERII